MKSVTLRTLLREPLKVKRMTRAGAPVQVTDKGEPLWVLHPAANTRQTEVERRREIEQELQSVLREPRSPIPLSQLVIDSRR
jgi:hypothetical protein